MPSQTIIPITFELRERLLRLKRPRERYTDLITRAIKPLEKQQEKKPRKERGA